MLSSVQREIYQHGHSEDYKIITLSEKYFKIKDKILAINDIPLVECEETSEMSKKSSEYFMKSKFNLHNVASTSYEELTQMLGKISTLSEDDLITIFNKKIPKIDPYQIPVEPVNIYFPSEGVCELNLLTDNKDILKRIDTVFSHINISRITDVTTSGIFTHEITHTQLNSVKGSTKYYHHAELLPIFLQLVNCLEKDPTEKCLEIEIIRRSVGIAQDIEILREYNQYGTMGKGISLPKTSKYIASALKALNLFEIYYNSSNVTQQKIINYIQKIFDGENIVEGLLEEYNVTADDDIKIYKRLGR